MPSALWPVRWKFCRAPSISTATRPKSCKPRMLMEVPGSSPRSASTRPACRRRCPTSASASAAGAGSDRRACRSQLPGRAGRRLAGGRRRSGLRRRCTGADRTVLTGASVSLTRSRVLWRPPSPDRASLMRSKAARSAAERAAAHRHKEQHRPSSMQLSMHQAAAPARFASSNRMTAPTTIARYDFCGFAGGRPRERLAGWLLARMNGRPLCDPVPSVLPLVLSLYYQSQDEANTG